MADTLTLTDIEDLANWALTEYKLDEQGWRFTWDRAVRRLGQCRYSTRTIGLSKPVFEVEANRELALNTILHEIAHALVGGHHGHDATWRHTAAAIGAKPERCASLAAQPDLPIKGHCGCETVIHQMARMPRRSYSCNRCRQTVTWRRTPKGTR